MGMKEEKREQQQGLDEMNRQIMMVFKKRLCPPD